MIYNIQNEVQKFKKDYKDSLVEIKNDFAIYLPFTVMSDILEANRLEYLYRPVKALNKNILTVKFRNVFDNQMLSPNEKRMCIRLISDFDSTELYKLWNDKDNILKVDSIIKTGKYKLNELVPEIELDIIEESDENDDESDECDESDKNDDESDEGNDVSDENKNEDYMKNFSTSLISTLRNDNDKRKEINDMNIQPEQKSSSIKKKSSFEILMSDMANNNFNANEDFETSIFLQFYI